MLPCNGASLPPETLPDTDRVRQRDSPLHLDVRIPTVQCRLTLGFEVAVPTIWQGGFVRGRRVPWNQQNTEGRYQ